jgi:2-octaprenylphenol hydroxylase
MKQDIVIIGGGIVGLATAASLAAFDFNIAVVDAKDIKVNLSGTTDLRVYAINSASQQLLTNVKAWQNISATKLSPYLKMFIWDELSSGSLKFSAQELGSAHLGHIVEETVLKNALLDIISKLPNISLHANTQLKSVNISDDCVFIETDSGDIKSKLVIGADGANSWLRNELSFECKATPYENHAIVCNLSTQYAHEQTAYQRFTHEGPLAFLPLKDAHKCSIVWSVPPKQARELMSQSNEVFCQSISKALDFKLGDISNLSQRVSFPLIERQVKPFIKNRAILVGDALHTIHPLAGLGVNLGLADVAGFVTSIKECKTTFDDHRTLRHFERSRKGEVLALTKLMKIIQQSFSSSAYLPGWLRGMGMNIINQSIFIKSQIIKLASGMF